VKAGKTVWLVGMMGAGKSTVGAELARNLGQSFVGPDREIAAEAGRSVAEIAIDSGDSPLADVAETLLRRISPASARLSKECER
jgi:shikimate kinase